MNTLSSNTYLNVLGQLNLDELHIRQTFDYYRMRYEKNQQIQRFVATSCDIDTEIRKSLSVGYCDRTMGKNIPKTKTYDGALIRGSLQRSGLIRASGHELFRGCVVFPTYHDNGNVISAIGYRVGRIRKNDRAVVYWRRPEPNAFVDTGMSLAKELIREQAYH